jgi:flagellar biosynthesis GTPase FlhF
MGILSTKEKQEIIQEKIKQAYEFFGKHCETKDDLDARVKKFFSLSERKYLDDKEIENYYQKYLDLYYEKIKLEKDQNYYVTPSCPNTARTQASDYQEKYDEFLANLLKTHEEELMSLRLAFQMEEENKMKENAEKLKIMCDQFQDKIEKIEKEAKIEKDNMKKKQKEIEDNFQRKIELINKQFKEERDNEKKRELEEKKKLLEEQKKKENQIKSLYKEKLKRFIDDKLQEIKNTFKQEENNFCMKEILKFDKEKIKSTIKQFLKTEKLIDFIIKQLKLYAETMKDSNKKIEHLNIVLVGPSGVGKSTLINAVLKPQQNCITGFGKPQTRNTEYIESEAFPFLRLADSQGIERDENLGVNSVYEKIKKFIETQIENKDSDKFIHCIWYCWTGVRLEQSEIILLKKLSEQYTLENLPVIIVYTKAIDPKEIEKAKKYIKEELKLDNCFIEVLAEEKHVNVDNKEMLIKPFNLDKLREQSVKLAKSAIKSSCYQGLIEDIKERINNKIKDIMVKLKEKIKKDKVSILKNFEKNYNIDELYNQTIYIILNSLYKYSLLKHDINIDNYDKFGIRLGDMEFSFSNSSLYIIKDFVMQYFQECYNSYNDNLTNFLKKHTENLNNEIIEFRNQFNFNHDFLLTNIQTTFDIKCSLKKEMKDNILEMSRKAVLKNSFNYITDPLIEKIGEYFIELYGQGIEQKSFINYASSIVKISFEDIEKKINEFNKLAKNEENKDNQEPAPNNNLKDSVKNDVIDLFTLENEN